MARLVERGSASLRLRVSTFEEGDGFREWLSRNGGDGPNPRRLGAEADDETRINEFFGLVREFLAAGS